MGQTSAVSYSSWRKQQRDAIQSSDQGRLEPMQAQLCLNPFDHWSRIGDGTECKHEELRLCTYVQSRLQNGFALLPHVVHEMHEKPQHFRLCCFYLEVNQIIQHIAWHCSLIH